MTTMFLFGVDKVIALAKNDNHDGLSRLLSRNPKLVHARDRNGNTCLLIAALYNRLDIGLLLLIRGADINAASGKGYTALHISVEKGFVNFATMLCERGADCNAINSNRLTALHLAVMNKTIAMINELCARGTMDAIDSLKRTPLHLAMQLGHVDIACMLVERGCDINIRDKEKQTPAEAARKLGYLGVCDIIDFRVELEKREAKEREKEDKERELKEKEEEKHRHDEAMALRANPPPPHPQPGHDHKANHVAGTGTPTGAVHSSSASVSSRRSQGSNGSVTKPSASEPGGCAPATTTAGGANLEGIDEVRRKKKKKVRHEQGLGDDASIMTGMTGATGATGVTGATGEGGHRKKKKKKSVEGGAAGDDDASTIVTTKSGAKKKKKKRHDNSAYDPELLLDGNSDMVSELSMSTLSLGPHGRSKTSKKKSAIASIDEYESSSPSSKTRRQSSRKALTSDPLLPGFRGFDEDDELPHPSDDLLVEHIAEDSRTRNAKLKSLVYRQDRGDVAFAYEGQHGDDFDERLEDEDEDRQGAAGGSPVLCGLYRTPTKRALPPPPGSHGSHGSLASLANSSRSLSHSASPGSKMRVAMDASASANTAALLRKERALQQQGLRVVCNSPEGRCSVM